MVKCLLNKPGDLLGCPELIQQLGRAAETVIPVLEGMWAKAGGSLRPAGREDGHTSEL